MNPVLVDIYSTVLPSAPFIIAAYVILWVVLLVYVVWVARGLKKTETQVALLEKQMDNNHRTVQEEDDKSGFGVTDSR